MQCDGQSPCGRCSSRSILCQFASAQSTSKSELRQEIDDLRQQLNSSINVISLLKSTTESTAIAQAYGGSKTPPAGPAAPSFQTLDTKTLELPSILATEPREMTENQELLSPVSIGHKTSNQSDAISWVWSDSKYQLESTQAASDHCIAHGLLNKTGAELPQHRYATGNRPENDSTQFLSAQQLSFGLQPAPGSWTTITDDIDLVHHLLALFFCWEYPIFVSVSRKHFIQDFRNGKTKYCSTILVNAMLALGCRFSNQSVGRGDAHDHFSAGDLFFQQATTLLDAELDHHSLTSIQALGLMSLREISCGRPIEAQYLSGQAIRLAVEMGLHKPPDERASSDDALVLSTTFWGAYALDK